MKSQSRLRTKDEQQLLKASTQFFKGLDRGRFFAPMY
jgi:hypothetical protein